MIGMGAGNFFAGLLGGYTGTVVRNESRAYNQEMQARELDVNAALKALDEAVRTGDQGAMQAAAANFQRSVNAIREPFHTGLGGGKGKGKKQGQQDPLVSSIVQGMIQHGTKQAQPGGPSALPAMPTIPGQGARPGYDPGMTFGQPAQSAGLAPVPVMASRNAPQAPTGIAPVPQVQSQAPQTGNQPAVAQGAAQQAPPALPQMPQRPATLADVYAAEPSPESQARRQENIREATASQQFAFDQRQFDQKVQKLEALGGEKLSKADKEEMYRQSVGLAPKNDKPIPLSRTPVTAGELAKSDPSATTFDGTPVSQLDPNQKVLSFFLNGKVLAIPGSGVAGGAGATEGGIYTMPDGSVVDAYRNSRTGEIVNSSTNETLTGGTFAANPHLATSGTGTQAITTFGPNGEPMLVQVPTYHTSQKVAPGGGTARGGRGSGSSSLGGGSRVPGLPAGGRVIGPKFEALSNDGKKALKGITMGTGMMDRIGQTLDQNNMQNAGGWWDSAKAGWEWEKYKHHRPTDPPYDVLIPNVSLLRVILSSPYLQGLRNFNWVETIGNHLPDVWDPPKLVEQKMTQLRQNLPLLQRAIYENEQPGGPQAAEARKQDERLAGGAAQPSTGPKQKVGDVVTLKDGRRARITKLLKGGKYDAVLVQ